MKTIELRDVKRGEFLKRRTDSIKIYRRGEYDREYGKYRCDDLADCSRDILLDGGTVVFIGFTY